MDTIQKIFAWVKNQMSSLAATMQGAVSTDDSQCSKRGLHLEKKQLNRTIALLIITGVALFVGGYFWGQYAATEQVLNAVDRDSFADQIYYSMCSANEQKDEEEESAEEAAETEGEDASESSEESEGNADESKKSAGEPSSDSGTKKTYFAALAGFGQHKTAENYARRLKARGYPVHVAKRVSRSARGKTVAWYQVVTDDFTDRHEGERVVAQLRTQENLRSIQLTEK